LSSQYFATIALLQISQKAFDKSVG